MSNRFYNTDPYIKRTEFENGYSSSVLLESATDGIGYVADSERTFIQEISKAEPVQTGVLSGTIIVHNSTLDAGDNVSFAVLCPVNLTDNVIVTFGQGGSPDSYRVSVTSIGVYPAFRILIENITSSPLSESFRINYIVIRG